MIKSLTIRLIAVLVAFVIILVFYFSSKNVHVAFMTLALLAVLQLADIANSLAKLASKVDAEKAESSTPSA